MFLFVFILGLTIGSFLNVLIFRLPKNRSILGFSRCPYCQKKIAWHDNIPVISFFLLRGRCRNCRSRISLQYPLVELLTGFLFLFSFWIYGSDLIFLIYILFFTSLFIVVATVDFKHFLILDELILAGFIGSLIFIFLFRVSCLTFNGVLSCSLKDSLSGVLFFAGILLFLFLISRGKWIGFGDVKLAALIGFIFGLGDTINIFYQTFLLGFILAIILLILKRADLKTRIPLGSLISVATIFFLLSGFNLLELIDSDLILRLWPR